MLEKMKLGEHMKVLDKEMLEKLKAEGKVFEFKGPEMIEKLKLEGPAFSFGGQKLDDLLASLTADQKAKMQKQGYLTPKDLNEKQRVMLGKLPDGKWELHFTKDGKSIKIRGS
jgi:hypothetical protein